MDFCACLGQLPALHSNLEEGDSLAAVEGNLEEDSLAAVRIPVAVEGIPVEEDTPAVVYIPVGVEEDTHVVDILEEASDALQSQIVAAHADLHLSHALPLVEVLVEVVLLAAVRGMVLLLVVRMVVPGCPYISPSLASCHPERSEGSPRAHTGLPQRLKN
jgi:hypothetical protein